MSRPQLFKFVHPVAPKQSPGPTSRWTFRLNQSCNRIDPSDVLAEVDDILIFGVNFAVYWLLLLCVTPEAPNIQRIEGGCSREVEVGNPELLQSRQISSQFRACKSAVWRPLIIISKSRKPQFLGVRWCEMRHSANSRILLQKLWRYAHLDARVGRSPFLLFRSIWSTHVC